MLSAPLLTLLVAVAPSFAGEVDWEGHYRGRGLVFNSLSLADEVDNANAEGASAWTDHRLRLQPTFWAHSKVSIHAQLDMLPLGEWGDTPNTYTDTWTDSAVPLAFTDGVAPYDDEADGGSYLRNVSLTRAWGEVYTPIGKLSAGRMPLDWGAQIMLNDGLDPEDEFGDTGDRVQLQSKVGPIYLLTGLETVSEGFKSVSDDMHIADVALAYRRETVGLGLYNRVRFQDFGETYLGYTGDLWGFAELGYATIEAEVVGVVGRGDLDTGANDVRVSAIGAMVSATVERDRLYGALELGYASGDQDPNDSELHTFAFDRDHNPTIMLFEEPMPTLEPAVLNDSNGGRELGAVRTGEGISNAMYLNPKVGYLLTDEVSGDLSVFAARMARPSSVEESRPNYGVELDVNLRYQPVENFYLKGTGALFLPGSYFSQYESAELGGGFGNPAVGGRLYGTFTF